MSNKLPLFIVLFLPFVQQTLCSVVIKVTDEGKTVKYEVKKDLRLTCNVTETTGVEVKWYREEKLISSIKGLEGRYQTTTDHEKYSLKITKADDNDAGMYTCAAFQNGQNVSSDSVRAVCKIKVKTPTNINVVEGERLRIHCMVLGNPPPKLHWTYSNETYNETIVGNTSRVILEKDGNIENAFFRIDQVEVFDRGNYVCIGVDEDGIIETSNCMVRIKDKYAALWPFLGICAEVFILCAIIFIYEKKRNKTELEESDTDQSPDQKNTPDHGKDSNLRHRQ